ncbi:MAG: hypothetical protein ACYTGH_15305, partial [Planctomycetota bacterium]
TGSPCRLRWALASQDACVRANLAPSVNQKALNKAINTAKDSEWQKGLEPVLTQHMLGMTL